LKWAFVCLAGPLDLLAQMANDTPTRVVGAARPIRWSKITFTVAWGKAERHCRVAPPQELDGEANRLAEGHIQPSA